MNIHILPNADAALVPVCKCLEKFMNTSIKLRALIALLLFTLSTQSFSQAKGLPTRNDVGPDAMTGGIAPIKAPFQMPQLSRPAIPEAKVTISLKKKGKNTKAIQSAIDKLAARGGGTVEIPVGEWLTGRIELKSNINLHIPEGATLRFSGKIKDYLPVVFTRDEGIDIYSLGAFIYANNAENIALTGKGKIVGPSTDCEIYKNNHEKALNIENVCKNGEKPLSERVYDGEKNGGEVFLPKSIAPINCKNVLIEGITVDQGLYWNIVPQYCENVIIRGVTVSSFGHGRTDGIDIESSKNVLVEYCSLDCQDDCYTMKSGRGKDGLRVNKPTENVVIRKCLALRGAGGIVIGTEVAGGVKNIFMENCVFDGTNQAFRFKTLRSRGGGIDGVYVERVRANVLHNALYINMLGSVKWGGELAKRYPARKISEFTPCFRNIFIHDVAIDNCDALMDIHALPEQPVKNVFFGNVKANCKKIGKICDALSFTLKDVTVTTSDSTVTIDGSDYACFYGFNNAVTGKPIAVRQTGTPSKHLSVQDFPLHPVHYTSVQPGKVWLDNNGRPIQAHGFQIFYDDCDSVYYWYGENKQDAIQGTNKMFGGVRLYSSKDFYNWTDEGLILPPDAVDPMSPIHYSQKLERPHIIYCEKTKKYVLWGKSQDTDGYFVVFQADCFRGPYTFVRNMKPEGFGVGDFDLWVSPKTQSSKAYVLFERPHWELICAELTDDYTNVTDRYSEHFVGLRPPFTREAPTHFVHNGKHYLFTSGTTGYTSNPSEVAEFTDFHGEYKVLGDPHVGDSMASSFNSQITSVIRIPGKKDLYVALADRWEPQTTGTDIARKTFKSKEKAYLNHQPVPQDRSRKPVVRNREYELIGPTHDVYNATYVFLPITFDKKGMPTIAWKDNWRLEDYK